MAIAAHPQASAGDATNGHEPADVLVVFGITGDLAKVMTFNSLYRLEQRGLLDCPIVGVAVDDWTVDDLRERARTSIEAGGEPRGRGGLRAARGAALLRPGRLRRSGDVRARGRRDRAARSSPVFYLEIPPFLFGTVVGGLADAGLTENARVVVEKPFGHDVASARALNDGDPRAHRRVAAVPDRPLPREDGPRRDPLPAVRERDASSRSGTASTCPACRSRWPRTSASRTAATSTTRSARCATWSSTT